MGCVSDMGCLGVWVVLVGCVGVYVGRLCGCIFVVRLCGCCVLCWCAGLRVVWIYRCMGVYVVWMGVCGYMCGVRVVWVLCVVLVCGFAGCVDV